jgi:hypothetical protein
VVVDDVGEVVGGEAVGLEQDLVVDVGVVEGDLAAELVAEGGGAFGGYLEADGVGAAFGEVGGDLVFAEVAVRAVVARCVRIGGRGRAGRRRRGLRAR